MANNKVQLSDGTVLLDLTQDTVTPDKLALGVTAHNKAGAQIVGTMSGDVVIEPITVTQNGIYTPPPDVDGYAPVLVNVAGGGGAGTVEHGVQFIDYDGSVVAVWDASEVASKTALPGNPTHDRLVAQGWNWDLQNIKDYIANYPDALVTVGQMYKTASGLTEIDITVTKVTGLTVTFKMSGTKNWGDGTTDSKTSHTYTDYGDYTITCGGTSIPAGTSSSGGLFGTTTTNQNRFWCTAIRIGEGVNSIGAYSVTYCAALQHISIPSGVSSIGTYAFYQCRSLESISLPSPVTAISDYTLGYCNALRSVSIPNRVTTIGNYAVYYCNALTSISIPDSVTSIGSYAFGYSYSVSSVVIPNSVQTINNNAFYNCSAITSVSLPASVTSIGAYAFYACYSLVDLSIPAGVSNITNNVCQNCFALRSVSIQGDVTSIAASAFPSCFVVQNYDFTKCTTVPTLANTNAFNSINGICKILVPASLYNSWIAATNWTTYAKYIYPV